MRSFSNPGLTDSQTRSGLASAVTIAAAAMAAACTLCVSPRHSARHMLGVVRAMRASRVSARRVCEKHLNECELGPQDTNERERWRKCRGRRVTHTHRHTHTLSQQKSVPVCVSRSRVRESSEPRVSARRVRVDGAGFSLSFGFFFPQYAVLLRIMHVFLLYYGTSNTLHNTPKIRKEYVRNTCTCILHSDT